MADINTSGPAYPPPPVAGSNAIGNFTIGASPIGDIPAFDPWSTICSQSANSEILTGLITSLAAAADQTANFQSFYDNIWNIDTATGYGLQLWGRIVDISNVVTVTDTGGFFGFAEGGAGNHGFAETGATGAFYSSAAFFSTINYVLPDDTYRRLIKAKAAANITNCSVPAINQILQNLFPNRGNAYVAEGSTVTQKFFGFAEGGAWAAGFAETGGQGTFYSGQTLPGALFLTYVFEFPLSPAEYAIVANSGVLPTPAGTGFAIQVNA